MNTSEGDINSAVMLTLRSAGVDVEQLSAAFEQKLASVQTVNASLPNEIDGSIALEAAVRGRFEPSHLGITDEAGAGPNLALESILSYCEIVRTGPKRFWQLKPSMRRNILMRAERDGTLLAAVMAVSNDSEGEGPLLRAALLGNMLSLEDLSTQELDHLAIVAEWLNGTNLATLPDSAEIRRTLRKRELLDPFRQLVGRPVRAGGDPRHDRVVGRVQEIEQLRAYVGIVSPDLAMQYVTRQLSSFWSTLTFSDAGNEPFLIQGGGGIGKSTLIAKFVLDHALIPGIRLPFAYLDFDRAALAPRQPLQLLIEIALQLETWIPEIEAPLRILRAELRSAVDVQGIDETRRVREQATRSELRAFCQKLRQIVEGYNRGEVPMILLFDTFEIVQYDVAAIESVTSLIAALANHSGKDTWSNLRIVVAGRAEMHEIKTSHRALVLDRLTERATQELILLRSEQEGIGLTRQNAVVLAKPLHGSPLDVVIVLNWLKSHEVEARPELIKEIVEEASLNQSSGCTSDGHMATQRVTGILIARMIRHINDPEVRQLANPGLVVRRITPSVIRAVMAPSSNLVASDDELSVEAADELFRRLARERWLVERERQSDVLRHRPEVRTAMLSLMRLRDRAQFEAINSRAAAYFLSQPGDDKASRAEAIYHLLLSELAMKGDAAVLAEIDRLWKDDVGPYLSGAVDDLTGQSQTYLKARLGRSVPVEKLTQLPAGSLTSVLLGLGRRVLMRYAPEATLKALDASESSGRTAALTGVRIEALYRTGRWDEMLRLTEATQYEALTDGLGVNIFAALRQGAFDRLHDADELAGNPSFFLLRWAARDRRAVRSPIASALAARSWPVSQFLKLSDAFWDFATMLCAGMHGSASDPEMRMVLDMAGELCTKRKRLPLAATDGGALRILAIFDNAVGHPILSRVNFTSHFSTICGPELRSFGSLLEVARPNSASAFEFGSGEGLRHLGSEFDEAHSRGQKLLRVLSGQPENVVIADPMVTREFAGVVKVLVETAEPSAALHVRAMLALTHPDWLEPLGNSLTRAFRGVVPSKLGFLSSVERYLGSSGRPSRISKNPTGHEILSLADESGNLLAAVRAYRELLRSNTSSDARDFLTLSSNLETWASELDDATRVPLAA